ncbi:MAG: sugar ABC transporter permease [Bifidobacteriaceae bacterium]|nr:sugar ABC transporter permease [Bifidobacteriaceae bacterium]
MAITVKSPAASSAGSGRRSGGAAKRRYHGVPAGMTWVLPGFVMAVGVIYFCIGYTGYVSLLPWNWRPPKEEVVEGLGNFARAFSTPLFWECLKHTLIFFIAVYLVQTVMGIVFAAIMHSRVYCSVIFKILIFVPVVVAPAIMSPVHRRVFAVDGPLNWILAHLGFLHADPTGKNPAWNGWFQWVLDHIGLSSVSPNWIQPSTALWVVIGIQIWSSIGMAFILFFAAMGQIDPEVLEAARIDGAGNIRVLVSVIIPQLKPTIVSLAVLNAITALKLFDYPYLVTTGGPANASQFLGTYIYSEMFEKGGRFGYAASMSMLLLVLAIGVSIIMTVMSRERKPEEVKV